MDHTATISVNPDSEPPGSRSLAALLRADIARMAMLVLTGCAAVAAWELVCALVTTPAPDVDLMTGIKVGLIDVTLMFLLWLGLVPLFGAAAAGARLVLALGSRSGARAWPGLLAPRPPVAAGRARPLAAWLWAGLLGVSAYLGLASYITFRAITYFKEPQLTALLLSLVHLGMLAVVGSVVYVLGQILGRAGRALAARMGRLGRLSPLGHVDAAVITMLVLAALALRVVLRIIPQLEPLIPWRHIAAAAIFFLGMLVGRWIIGRRGSLMPASGRRRLIAIAASLAGSVLIAGLTLVRFGADHEAKSVAMTGSPLLSTMIDLVRRGTDVDGDGYGFLLGENDCAPFDSRIHPLARDIADNGIDEDCNGRDFSFKTPPKYKKGERIPVPEEFRRDWNFLLLTVDTVRYDHTGFGGYIETKNRDTTPNLDKLVERSVSFTFANAPSAGTMASVPAILTSKFFHSGIALDEDVKPGMPPRLKPENVLISELLKQKGYYTGAILTHEYFNDWGMEQGFDTYDNEIGKVRAPFKVTSHEVTDKAIAWIAHNSERKWFLWAHYIDPHGRYVAHPGEQSFGTTEEDLYDGELYYTDKHIGRLLKELSAMPGADRTIIVITSDHGDGFGEHGFVNHGFALYRELLHVPLIFSIPDALPRTVDGAVTPLDIVPTISDLAGVDTSAMRFEGESLVPQLFYGKDARERVVFAETNAPRPIRAVITDKHKLIYKLKENVYEFYDLVSDPWEKRNIYGSADKDALGSMKEYLDEWLERVYFSRDTLTNQAAGKLADFILTRLPEPKQPSKGVRFDGGAIEVVGIDTDKASYTTGDKLKVVVYFHVKDRPSRDFRIQVQGWLADDSPASRALPLAQSKLRYTADGLFPSSRWREGEYIRERFQVPIPPTWKSGSAIAIGMHMIADGGVHASVSGPTTRPGADHVVVLGKVRYHPKAAEPAPGTAPAPKPAVKSKRSLVPAQPQAPPGAPKPP